MLKIAIAYLTITHLPLVPLNLLCAVNADPSTVAYLSTGTISSDLI